MPTLLRVGLLLTAIAFLPAAAGAACPGPFALQVLGSGGPEIYPDRAGSGYLVWLGGKARILIDAGGGTLARFGASGARFEDLDLVALTHLHADHAGELPVLLKAGFFTSRTRPLRLAGPTGGGVFPDLEHFLDALVGPRHGAFRYLSGYLDGSGGLVRLQRQTLDASRREPMPVLTDGPFTVTAMGVTHGPVPALAYRVDYAGRSIVFSGDQNGDDPQFPAFAHGADVLVMDHAVPEDARGVAANLHALPSEIATIAKQAGVKRLLLSHIMERSQRVLDQSLAIIARGYGGKVEVARDLLCLAP